MMSEILNMTARDIVKNVREKKLSQKDVAVAYLKRIEAEDRKWNAFVRTNEQLVDLAQERDAQGKLSGDLCGLPLGIKDLFCTHGMETTASSKILQGFIPPYTATCVSRLQEQGAFVLGKLNMDEFAMGSSNEMSIHGVCRNPWDKDRVPGGSSGGSAAAVAARMAPVALGSDTGGSIRQPSHFCGLAGIKPTYGSVSRFGMVAFASSLDQAGPMAHNIGDCGLVLDGMIGEDSRDLTTVQRRVGRLNDLSPTSLKGVRFGRPKEYFSDEVSEETRNAINALVAKLQKEGAEIVDVSLPHTEYAVPVYYMVAASEASSNLSRYDGVRYGFRKSISDVAEGDPSLESMYQETRSSGFGDEVQRRILLGTYALSSGYYDAFYQKACQVRRLISLDFQNGFKNCDYILSPVAVTTAFKIGEKIDDPVAMYFNDIFTTPSSLAGLPGMSLPIGLDSKGLPIGAQLVGPAFCEEKMISHGMAIENLVEFQGAPHV